MNSGTSGCTDIMLIIPLRCEATDRDGVIFNHATEGQAAEIMAHRAGEADRRCPKGDARCRS